MCNHTCDSTSETLPRQLRYFVNNSYDYRPNWIPLSPIAVKNQHKIITGIKWGGQGGQNLPPPVPYSPASRTFISRLPPVFVLLPSPVNWQSQNTS